MNRFFVNPNNISGSSLIINDREQLHHIKDVLYLKTGDKIEAFDEKGIEYVAALTGIKADSLSFKIIKKNNPAGNFLKLTIACAIPKNAKMDDIVDKLTQLGAVKIIPMETERVIVRLDKEKKEERLARWRKIAMSAAKQSHRNNLPEIEPITPFKDVILAADSFDLKLIPTLEGRRKSLGQALKGQKNILALIGPEGDFSAQEVKFAISRGFIPISLGQTVLRVDTAALAIASRIFLK